MGCLLTGGVLLKHLLDWWQLRFVEYDRKAREAMKSESPEKHPDYWDAVSSVSTVDLELAVKLHLLPVLVNNCGVFLLSKL